MVSTPPPVVRDLILCEEIIPNQKDRKRVTLINVFDRIQSNASFPFRPEKLSAFARLTECRSAGRIRLEIVRADTDSVIYTTLDQKAEFPNNPLAVHWISFRIRRCDFPAPGLFWVRLLYDDRLLREQPLELRG
jgi:hypothetical protein